MALHNNKNSKINEYHNLYLLFSYLNPKIFSFQRIIPIFVIIIYQV